MSRSQVFGSKFEQASDFEGRVGRSENKTLTKFSSYENEVRPGVVMTDVFFLCLQGVNPSILDIVVKFDHSV